MTLANHEFTFKQTLLLTAALLIGLLALITLLYRQMTYEDITHEFAHNIQTQMAARYNLIQNNLDKQKQRIKFLHLTPPISGIVRAMQNSGIDPEDKTQLEQWKTRLAIIFESFIENNPDILQLRYIGAEDNGKELVRVERQGTNIRRIKPERLQSKGDSDYFKEISQYHPGEIYISNINLNREYGKIQIPFTPTQRIAMPVFDYDTQFFGFIIMNLDAQQHINEYVHSLSNQLRMYVLNNEGGFIYHPDPDIAFAFETQPESQLVWQNIFSDTQVKVDSSNIENHKHVLVQELNQLTGRILNFDSKIFFLSGLNQGRTLSLVIGVDESTILGILNERTNSLVQILFALMSLIFCMFAYYQANVHKRLGLIRSQAEFKAIISGSQDGIIAMDEFGHITGWNDAATNITGYPEHVAMGMTVFELFLRNNDEDAVKSLIQNIYYKNGQESFECTATSQKNTSIELSIHLSPIILDNGKTIGVAAILRDITEQKITEREILELNSSLEAKVKARTEELENARNLALQSNEAKSEFIANVSHEIRTPMNGVLGMLELLAKDPLTPKQQHQLEMAKFSAHHLTHLVNDILDMSKIEAGKLEIDNSEFDLIKFLSDVSTSLSIRAQAKDLEFILDASNVRHEHVIGDVMRINQIITNLVGNALKFTQKGEIALVAETKEMDQKIMLECTVMDTGKGIKEDKLQNLFESFTQEDSSITKTYGGTGLGLSISRQLCHLMQGEIHVNSEEGKGSQFTFTVSLSASINKNQEIIEAKFKEARILLASPNIRILNSLNQQLQSWQCQTQIAHTSSACLNLLKQNTAFNIIIIDENITQDKDDFVKQLNLHTSIKKCDFTYLLETVKSNQDHKHGFLSLIKPATPFALFAALDKAFNTQRDAFKPDYQYIREKEDENLLNGKSVLLVDDNQINLEVANGILEDFGVIVTMANSAQACFDALEYHYFDAILMDCQMPVMDGYTATRKIRNGEAGAKHKDMTIIAMTAHAMTGAKDTCIAAGMNDYIPKPVVPDYLKTVLLKWIGTHSNSSTNHQEAANSPKLSNE
ncbi:MAG: response regulator [Gammaproteobacteria bacterium]|nr:response regulator [Gammaproteobacteria bacterium]